jgi:hypothetical protein
MLYVGTRKTFELTAQAAVRCIAKVADAYTTQKAAGREGVVRFRKHAAQPYDDRIFRFVADNMVSIWTLVGRMKIAFVGSERQRALLAFRKGEVDLMLVRGKWYLAIVCDVPDPEKVGIEDVLGVDFGVVNLACDSDGIPAPTEKRDVPRRLGRGIRAQAPTALSTLRLEARRRHSYLLTYASQAHSFFHPRTAVADLAGRRESVRDQAGRSPQHRQWRARRRAAPSRSDARIEGVPSCPQDVGRGANVFR